MVEKAELKAESLLNLDDLLQCPVCYEIPVGQIFQCNEGHHVCGRCKMRLDVCPVCRALFFGTRNYAMEELIANFRKLRALKSGNKSATGSGSSENTTPARDVIVESENEANDVEETSSNETRLLRRAPQACKGLFRCLCCKSGNGERLPAARLLNHLRYFHAPDLLEGRSENEEYLQAWQFGTASGKSVTAIRVADMGIFYLSIEISNNLLCAWLSMAASPWITQLFNYTLTLSGNDREAIFSDSVYSVRSCEGTLRKNGHCLLIKQADARSILSSSVLNGKLSIRRTAPEQMLTYDTPRIVMRIASRRDNQNNHNNYNLEPFLQDLQNDVARLSRAFANIGRDATTAAIEAEVRARLPEAYSEHLAAQRERAMQQAAPRDRVAQLVAQNRGAQPVAQNRVAQPVAQNRVAQPVAQNRVAQPVAQNRVAQPVAQNRVAQPNAQIDRTAQSIQRDRAAQPAVRVPQEQPAQSSSDNEQAMTRTARRRMRQRLRTAFDGLTPTGSPTPPAVQPQNANPRQNGFGQHELAMMATAAALPPVPPPSTSSGPSQPQSQPHPHNGNNSRNKKKRRHRR